MKRVWWLVMLLWAGFAQAQSVRYDSNVTTVAKNVPAGAQAPIYSVPFAKVTVCEYPATGSPCTNTVPVYSDQALTQPLTQPLSADSTGAFGFWIAPGTYSYSVQTQSGAFQGTYPVTLTTQPGPQGQPGTPGTVTASGVNGDFIVPGKLTAGNNYGGCNLFGDSLTFGAGATMGADMGPLGTSTAAILNNRVCGGGGQNYAKGGDQAADMSLKVYLAISPTVSANNISVEGIFTNDVNVYGTNTDKQDTAKKALLASAAWAGVPDVAKVFADQANCTYTGTWNTDTSILHGKYAQTTGATATCTVHTYANVLYVGYLKEDGFGNGSATVTVDGVACSEGTLLAYGLNGSTITTANGSPYAMALGRCTGLTPGTHTLHLTTLSSGVFDFFWAGGPYTPPAGTVAPPLVVLRGVPYFQHDNYSSLTAQYDGFVQSIVTTLVADGLNVKFANPRARMNYTVDFDGGADPNFPNKICPASVFGPDLHYGDCGHAHVADSIIDVLAPFVKSTPNAGPAVGLAVATTGYEAPFIAPARYTVSQTSDPRDGYRAGLMWDGTTEFIEAPGTLCLSPNGGYTLTTCPYQFGSFGARLGYSTTVNAPLAVGTSSTSTVALQPSATPYSTAGSLVQSLNPSGTNYLPFFFEASYYAFMHGPVGIGASGTPRRALDINAPNPTGGVLMIQNTSSAGTSSADISDNTGALQGGLGYGNSSGFEAGRMYLGTTSTAPVDVLYNGAPKITLDSSGVAVPGIAPAASGTRFVCIDTTGHIVSSATACSGT